MNWFWPSDAAIAHRQAGQTPLLHGRRDNRDQPLSRRDAAPQVSRPSDEDIDVAPAALRIRRRVAAWIAGRDRAPEAGHEGSSDAIVVDFPNCEGPGCHRP